MSQPTRLVYIQTVILTCFLTLPYAIGFGWEGDILYKFAQGLDDPEDVFVSWDNKVHPCLWQRISCDADYHVERVDLNKLNLSGSLIPELGNLAFLAYLRLGNNKLTGSIPLELTRIPNLFVLDLSYNQLSGEIPKFADNVITIFEGNPDLHP